MFLREALYLTRIAQPQPLAFHTAERSPTCNEVLRDLQLGVPPGNPPVSQWEAAQRYALQAHRNI